MIDSLLAVALHDVALQEIAIEPTLGRQSQKGNSAPTMRRAGDEMPQAAPADPAILAGSTEYRLMDLTRIDSHSIAKEPGLLSVFVCIRNERIRLKQFLSHHRRIGARRFFFIDNGSTDGSEEFLLEQPDAHIWRTSDSYRESEFGVKWLSALLDEFAHNEWALILDADELLIFPGCEEFQLHSLCKYLDRLGSCVLRTLLLDMYSNRSIRETTLLEDQNVLEVCLFFDRGPYWRHGASDFGGARRRVFWSLPGNDDQVPPCLTNFPLQRWRRGTKLHIGRHFSDLPGADLASVTGALLHFKMIGSLIERAGAEVDRNEHWNGAAEYAVYARALASFPDLTLFDSCSVRYENSRQLVAMGLISATGTYWKRCRGDAGARAGLIREAK